MALAKDMIRYWLEPNRFDRVVQTIKGRWWPIYKDLARGKFWTDRPAYKIYPEMLGRSDSIPMPGPQRMPRARSSSV